MQRHPNPPGSETADTGVGSFDPAALRSAFPAVADWEVVALFPVGHPAADAAPSANHEKRKPLDEFVSEL